nr:DUF5995 family protein [Symbiobacterium terraclitae]
MGGADVGSIDDLAAVLKAQLDRFDRAGDHRAAFLRVYHRMTLEVRDRLRRPFFLDPPWVERVAIRFGWYYFDSLERFERGSSPPPAWEYAFRIAQQKRAFLLQDILLGMNAHINNDLPLVVAEILRAEGDEQAIFKTVRRRFDHDQINRVLHDLIPAVQDEIAAHYGRLVRPLGRLLGDLDQQLTTYGLKTWRDRVWRNARCLLAAETDRERELVVRFIEEDALAIAREIYRFAPLRLLRPLARLMRRWRLC